MDEFICVASARLITMRRQGADPILYVFGGLIVLALLCAYAAFAGRSCAKAMVQASHDPGTQPYSESHAFKSAAVEVPPKDYDAFMRVAKSIDFGIGVKVGMTKDELTKRLGEAESVSRAGGGKQELAYMFPPAAKGPRPDDRHVGGIFDTVRMAVLMVTMRDDIAEEVLFTISPMSKEGDEWKFLTLGSKPIAQCQPDDFKALLGEPSHSDIDTLAWHFAPDNAPVGSVASIYIQAVFARPGTKLSELYIIKEDGT
jgi:hypothetical protein